MVLCLQYVMGSRVSEMQIKFTTGTVLIRDCQYLKATRMRKLFVLVLWCFCAVGCTSRQMDGEIRTALAANEAFYKQISAGQYDAIYITSSDELKASTSHDSLITLLKTVNLRSGSCEPATLSLTSYHLSGGIVDLAYVRRCKSGDINERFSWKIVNNQAVLNSYLATGPGLPHEKPEQ